ncbi:MULTISPECIES: hypothetical protein [Ochrobactrum]|uniref:hypothetical protein n=1 Tax=Ochrobactrum sp. C6C9 TaxID=2736662 RepID=UPI0035303264|nr:hypothetical protein [Ochrobactrum sp. C6C9]
MSLKSLLIAVGIGISGLTLTGCVSEGYYGSGGGYYDPYYVQGSYIGTGVVYDSGRYYRNYPRYYRDSRYRDYRYRDRDRRPNYNRPDRPRPPQGERPRPPQAERPSQPRPEARPSGSNRPRAYIRSRGNEPR